MSESNEFLEEWFFSSSSTDFPGHGKYDYHSRFRNVRSFLEAEVHPHVEKGSLVRQEGFLTGHGPDHVRTVIRRAGDLIGDPAQRLSPYEVYLLLMSAHYHDVGILLGREGHEKKAQSVMAQLGKLLGNDAVETRTIRGIAEAHGGFINGNYDTISSLPVKDHVLNLPVRKQFLAAILRFADELADDSERAARIPLALGVVPSPSEVYHQYAAHLHSVIIDHLSRTISLHFDLTKDLLVRTFGRGAERVYLLDELFRRTIKMHQERIYCMRFMDGVIRLDVIDAHINVFLTPEHQTPIHQIAYRLQEKGYPVLESLNISKLCPEVAWTGKSLREDLLNRSEGLEQ